MVQIIPENRRLSGWEKAGEALGGIVKSAASAYSQHQKQKKFEEAVRGVEETYSDPELSESQKLIKAYKQLSQFPDVAQNLGGQLTRLGVPASKSFAERLAGEQEQNRLAQSFQNIQNIYSNPDLTDEQKMFGVYQELSDNPTLAKNLLGSLQQPKASREETVAGKQFSTGYKAIQEGDSDTLRDVLESPDTPLSVKQKLTDLRDKFETRKGVQSRELRGRQSLVQKSYKQAINAERDKLKDIYNLPSKEERARINKRIKTLEAHQHHDLKKLTKDPEAYTKLLLWNTVDDEFLPEEEGLEEAQFEEQPREKIRFDSRNPEHVARAKQVLQSVGGDRNLANQILAEEFIK